MIGAPPLDVGATHVKATPDAPTEQVTDDGEEGVVTGVAVTGELQELLPSAFWADTRKEYSKPFANPVTEAVVAVPAGRGNTTQVVPPSLEN